MRNAKIGLLLILVLTTAVLFVPVSDDSSGAVLDDVIVYEFDHDVNINAGESTDVYIGVINNKADDIMTRIVGYEGATSKINITFSNKPVLLKAGESIVLIATLSTDTFASTQTDTIKFNVEIWENGNSDISQGAEIILNIYSSFSAGEDYNRIMGVWESPWEDATYATLLTFIIWILISFMISYIVIPQILFLFIKESKDNRRQIRIQIWKPLSLMIMLYALSLCARVYGIGEQYTATIDSIVGIAYILVGALITWRIYRSVVMFLFKRMSDKAGDIGIDGSLIPLFNMLGKIVIAVVAFASILSALGFDLLMILTGAGILGLAISLGAQNTLSQFFSGLTLLMTRPFKAGDQVTIGSNTDVLKVIRVGLMSTTFENGGNSGTYTMPNNTVATSVINNITGKTNAYKMTFFVGISYDADVDLAKKLLLEAAYENPRVISDGSYDKPSVRLESFDASSVNMRIAVYVEDFDDRGSITGQIKESLFKKFVENGISIPYPQIDVHMV